ncbi:MAG: leucine-rich repeat domain-containing protein, partial [Clostridia bacterium]|nr:leucine-rich repeat domain-containing protein [Clostridia bacterium]
MKKKAVSLIAALCMVFAMLPVMGMAADTSRGSCGENVSWTLDADGVLTISGAGKMDDYEYYGSPSEGKTAPWYEQKDSIKKVIIEDGVTSIGSNAFLNCGSVTSVEAAQSVESIGGNAFWNCSALVSIEIPKNVKSIGGYAFYNCSALKLVDTDDMDAWCRISFENALSNPLYYANALFAGGRVVSSVEIPSDMTAIGPYTFYGMSGLKAVTIPLGVTDIGESAFSGTSLETVYYYGSRTDWKKINIADDNDRLTSAGIGYNTNSNITWSLDGNGVLTISGTGKMQNYSLFHYIFYNDEAGDERSPGFKNLPPPWYEQRGSIKKIVIEKGV